MGAGLNMIIKNKTNANNSSLIYKETWLIACAILTFFILAAGFTMTADTTSTTSTSTNVYFSGTTILGSDELVNKINSLTTGYDSTDTQVSFSVYIGLFIYVAIAYFLLWRFILAFNEKNTTKVNILLMCILLLSILVIAKTLTVITIEDNVHVEYMMGMLIPVAAFSMLCGALLGRSMAIIGTIMVSTFLLVICDGNLLFVASSLCGGLLGVNQVAKLDQRGKYVTIALYIAVVNSLLVVAWSFMNGLSYQLATVGILMSFANGILSIVFAIGVMPFFETAFNITTVVRLLELSNFNNPLLKRLMLEAPGTYQHSILVGNLAEAAAGEVGANPLLARVGSYYHDIGKLKRPDFFIENQKVGENPHDKLHPNMSILIITSHTKEGLELAKEQKLPKEITDIIAQHHGTTFTSFFYQKAKNMASEGLQETIKESDFRYPGPKPQTKEAAIVSLADSVQATVQSMGKATDGQIEGKIRAIIRGKFDDDQLSECELTFKDLDKIAIAFTQVLAGVNHRRLSYPKEVELELARRAKEKNNEPTNNEQSKSSKTDEGTKGKVEGNRDDNAENGN